VCCCSVAVPAGITNGAGDVRFIGATIGPLGLGVTTT
jgi:hypothetical protein